jgi:hypothetical protein
MHARDQVAHPSFHEQTLDRGGREDWSRHTAPASLPLARPSTNYYAGRAKLVGSIGSAGVLGLPPYRCVFCAFTSCFGRPTVA